MDFIAALLRQQSFGRGTNLIDEVQEAVADRGGNLPYLVPGEVYRREQKSIRNEVRTRYFLDQARKARRLAAAMKSAGATNEEIEKAIHDQLVRHVGDPDPAYDPEVDRVDVWEPISEAKRGKNAGGVSLRDFYRRVFGF